MNGEGSGLLFDVNGEQVVESFVVGRELESFPRREDRDVRNTLTTLPRAIAAKGHAGIRWKEVACHVGTEAAGDGDGWCTIGNSWIRVVHHDGSTRGKCFSDQLFLAALGLPAVPHGVLADEDVRAGKTLAIER